MRDWNEEYQAARDVAVTETVERIVRDRSLHRIYTDFVEAAQKGAVAAVDGALPPYNPNEPRKVCCLLLTFGTIGLLCLYQTFCFVLLLFFAIFSWLWMPLFSFLLLPMRPLQCLL